MSQPRGLLALAVIVDVGEVSNPELRRLTVASQSITFKERETRLKKFHPANLLPKTDHYVTYEGSLTFPGCQETVTWVIFNSPIYISGEDLSIWNTLLQTKEEKPASFPSSSSATSNSNPAYMSLNYRPLRPINGRLLRTNINVQYKSRTSAATCPSNIYLDMGYRANPRRTHSNWGVRNSSEAKHKHVPVNTASSKPGRKQRNLLEEEEEVLDVDFWLSTPNDSV